MNRQSQMGGGWGLELTEIPNTGAFIGGGLGGRIRTFNLLIQSQLRYRCATPQLRSTTCRGYAERAPYFKQPPEAGYLRGSPRSTERDERSTYSGGAPIRRSNRSSNSTLAWCRLTAQPTPKTRSLNSCSDSGFQYAVRMRSHVGGRKS